MDTIVTSALIGTAHQQEIDISTGTSVDRLTEQIADGEVERKLLLSAGAWAIYRQAGQVETSLPTIPTPAATETLPVCSKEMARQVEAMLKGERADLLPDTLECLQRANLRLPHELLPTALNIQEAELRVAIFPLLGERGRWLSQFNPAWSWVTQHLPEAADTQLADAETIWQEGTPGQRQKILELLRANDPVKAREWLAAAWQQEKAEVRADFLSTLELGLSAEDEAFLKQALDDRAASVRALVPPLLARIPTSAFVQRMQSRADTMLSYTQKKLTVTLPASIDKEWERDGIVVRPPAYSGIGERAWWFVQVMQLVSPAYWQERFGVSPAKLLAASHTDNEWKETLFTAWSRAAVLHKNIEWMNVFWDRRSQQQSETALWEIRTTLLTLLSQQEAEQKVLTILTNPKYAGKNEWERLLAILPTPWSTAFGTAYLQELRQHIRTLKLRKNSYVYNSSWYQSTFIAARSLPPECFALALEPWAVPTPPEPETISRETEYWRQALDNLTEAMHIRQRILEELQRAG